VQPRSPLQPELHAPPCGSVVSSPARSTDHHHPPRLPLSSIISSAGERGYLGTTVGALPPLLRPPLSYRRCPRDPLDSAVNGRHLPGVSSFSSPCCVNYFPWVSPYLSSTLFSPFVNTCVGSDLQHAWGSDLQHACACMQEGGRRYHC